MKLILTFTLLFLSSCFFSEDGKIEINPLNSSFGTSNAQVSSVSIVNDQLVVNGSGLGGITKVQITGPSSFDHTFSIESKSDSNLIANGVSNIAFALDAIFSLTVTDANGSATYNVTFTLQDDAVTTSKILDGAVTAAKLSDMGAGTGQVLKYNGTTWVPGDLNALTYAGTWDASTATAPNVAPAAGEYYIVSVAAAGIDISDGSGSRNFVLGDWLVYNGSTTRWDKIDNASYVTSFNGRSGAVTPATNDYTWAQIDKSASVLSQINDVEAPAGDGSDTGKVLKWNNATSTWELGDDLSGGGAGSVTSTEIADGSITNDDVNAAAAIAYSKLNIADGDLTIAKTSGLQTTLDAKLPLAGGTMTGDLTMGANNIITSGNVDGVDVSTLATSVSTNTSTIAGLDTDDITEATNLYFTSARAIAAPITGFTSGAGTVAATDTVLQAIQKLDGNVTALDTDDVTEATNLYHTTTRARTAAVVNSTAGTETDQAASVSAMKTYVAAQVSGSGAVLADGSVAMTGNLDLGNNQLRLKSDNTNYVQMIAPNSLAATYTLTMPADDGTSGQVLSTNGTGTLSWISPASGSVTSVTGTAPIVSSGGTTPAISIAQANGSTDGFLDSADWTTFNNKQAAITTGTTAQYLRGDLSLSTFGTDVIGSAITGFTSGAGTVAATDTVLQAIQKLDGNVAALDTDDVTEATNLYFTDARAKTAAVVNSTAGTETDQAASVSAMKTYVAAQVSGSGAVLADGSVAMTGNLDLGNNQLRLKSDNTNYVQMIAPNSLAATYTLTMPADDGTSGQVLSTNGTGTLSWISPASGSVTSVTGTAPIVSSGGTTPAISIAQANGSTDGFLDSADWTTFNNKQAAITTGTTAQYLRGDLSLSTFGTDVIGSAITGFTSGAGTVVATDTVLQAIQKLDGNIAANTSTISGLDTDDISEATNQYFTNARAIAAPIAGFTSGAGTVAATDTVLQAIQKLDGNIAAAGDILDGGNTNGAAVTIGTNDAQSLNLETNNSTAMTILSGGNVGIGTTSPGSKLHLEESGDLSIRLRDTASNADAEIWDIGIGANGSGNSELTFRQRNDDGTQKAEVMRIDSSGNVGIGTTSPSAKLHIDDGNIQLSGAQNIYRGLVPETDMNLMIGTGAGSEPRIYLHGTGNGQSNAGDINLSAGGVSNQIILDTSGNVGIGTASPLGNFHVQDSGAQTEAYITNTGSGSATLILDASNGDGAGGDYLVLRQNDDLSGEINMPSSAGSFHIKTGGGTAFTVNQSADVGIGTTAPSGKLHVQSGSSTASASVNADDLIVENSTEGGISILTPNNTAGNLRFGDPENSNSGIIEYNHTSDAMNIYGANTVTLNTGGTTRLTADSSGNIQMVGATDVRLTLGSEGTVGTNSSNWIRGDEAQMRLNAASGGYLFEVSGTQAITVDSSRNVGIGTSAPTALLSVNGTANKPGGGSWGTFSDRRLKTVHGKFNRGLDEMMKLETIVYNYNDDNPLELANDGEHIGFVAQEIEKVIPEAVTYTEDGYLMLNNDPIIWTILNGSQEQQRIIENNIKMMKVMENGIESNAREIASLKAKNIILENEVLDLKTKNKKIEEQLNDLKSVVCSMNPSAKICQ